MPKQDLPMRLALRAEGDWWNAYLAAPNTMEGVKQIGSIAMGAVQNDPDIKQAFMDLMQAVVANAIKQVTGQSPSWNQPRSAPESERAGNA